MARDPRYDVLFEPVRIGPVTARNRFYQVPHCNGMGHAHPSTNAAMRGIKAEGGWAVVATEECEIHPSSDVSPYHEARLWDDRDLPLFARAAIELAHNGASNPNRYARIAPLAPSSHVIFNTDPIQPRVMDKRDIADVRRWHRKAALRARDAGFDIVYVYAGHNLSLPMHFIAKR
jgi:dimethylamine/trimethylamine dehydrogenase